MAIDFNRVFAIFYADGAAAEHPLEQRWRDAFPGATDEDIRAWTAQCVEIEGFADSLVATFPDPLVGQGAFVGRYRAMSLLKARYGDLDRSARATAVARAAYRAVPPVLKVAAGSPLEGLIAACAIHCQVDCCGINSIEVDTKWMHPWISRTGVAAAEEALQQLRLLMERVRGHRGPVVVADLCDEWRDGAECIAYLEIWCEKLQAAILENQGSP